MASPKPNVGSKIEKMSFPVIGSDRTVYIGEAKDRWTMLFVYRGKHCPRCKRFLNKLNATFASWNDVLDIARQSVYRLLKEQTVQSLS